MKDHPILFSTEMVRAILDGRKTQTQRVIKPPPPDGAWPCFDTIDTYQGEGWFFQYPVNLGEMTYNKKYTLSHMGIGPYGQPGDLLWVRETFAFRQGADNMSPVQISPERVGNEPIWYKADDLKPDYDRQPRGKWRPSIHMPKSAARLWLKVTDIRVERVQDISEEDAKAEGTEKLHEYMKQKIGFNYRQAFGGLWDSINAKRGYSWESNPWVWVVGFERTEP